LVKCQQTSAGKVVGSSNAKMGNAYLKWAFSEAAVLFLAKCPQGKELLARIEKRHGKAKALSILAHRIGRAVYFMLMRQKAFDLERFLRS
jgi:transposase